MKTMTYKLRLLRLCHEDFTDIRRPMTTDEARTHTDAILDPPCHPERGIPTDGGLRFTYMRYGGKTYHAYYAVEA